MSIAKNVPEGQENENDRFTMRDRLYPLLERTEGEIQSKLSPV